MLAILLGAPEGPALLDTLVAAEHPRMSVANWLEVAMLIEEKGGRLASLRFDEFFRTAGIELAPEQLRRHRRLAVRREAHLGGIGEALHPADVVGQRVAPDQRQRQRQVTGQNVPALGPHP